MKILVVAALFSCVAAAPSGEALTPVANVAIPAVTPTIDPGDIQAAAIDAQVYAEDQARALADKAIEEANEKVIESDSLVKEKQQEDFWAREDKKWQALDAVKTAEAQLDGAVANNANAIAKSALGGVVIPTYVAPQLLPAPIVRTPIVPGAPIVPAPLFPSPLIPAPFPNTLLPGPLIYANPGFIKPEEKEKEMVKTAELEKDNKQILKEEQKDDKKDTDPEKPLLKDNKPAENAKPAEGAEKLALPGLPLAAYPAPVAPLYFPQPLLTPVLKQW